MSGSMASSATGSREGGIAIFEVAEPFDKVGDEVPEPWRSDAKVEDDPDPKDEPPDPDLDDDDLDDDDLDDDELDDDEDEEFKELDESLIDLDDEYDEADDAERPHPGHRFDE